MSDADPGDGKASASSHSSHTASVAAPGVYFEPSVKEESSDEDPQTEFSEDEEEEDGASRAPVWVEADVTEMPEEADCPTTITAVTESALDSNGKPRVTWGKTA